LEVSLGRTRTEAERWPKEKGKTVLFLGVGLKPGKTKGRGKKKKNLAEKLLDPQQPVVDERKYEMTLYESGEKKKKNSPTTEDKERGG